MKRFIISTLSLIALSSFVTPAFAGEISSKKSNKNLMAASSVTQRQTKDITPFNLVTGSYQGRFRNQGIPSSAVFQHQVNSDRIKAEDLVKAAIASNRLGEETLQDRQYLSSVNALLRTLDED